MDQTRLAYPPLVDSVSDQTASEQFISLVGAQNMIESSRLVSAGSGTNQLTFQVQLPDDKVILDSTLLLEMDIEIVASPDTDNAVVNIPLGLLCLESFPIQKSIINMQMSINNGNINTKPYMFTSLYERLDISDEHRQTYYSMFPARLNDGGGTYNKMATTYGSAASGPFAQQNLDDYHDGTSRFNFPHYDVIGATAANSSSRFFHVVEPINLCNVFRDSLPHGLTNLDNFNLTITFGDMVKLAVCNPRPATAGVSKVNDFSKISTKNGALDQIDIGASSGFTGNTAVGQVPAKLSVKRSNETLWFRTVKPTAALPSILSIPYSDIRPYNTSFPAKTIAAKNAASNKPVTLEIAPQVVNEVTHPSFVYIVVRPALIGKKDEFTPDYLFPITKIDLQIGHHSGVLAGASPEQLYQISVRNGYNGSLKDWQQGGCVLVLRPGVDIPGVPGKTDPYVIQARITIGNYLSEAFTAVDLESNIFCQIDGRMELGNRSVVTKFGVSPSALASAMTEPVLSLDGVTGDRAGGSFRSFFRKVGNFLLPIASNVISTQANRAITGALMPKGGSLDQMGGASRQLGGNMQLGGAAQRRAMADDRLMKPM